MSKSVKGDLATCRFDTRVRESKETNFIETNLFKLLCVYYFLLLSPFIILRTGLSLLLRSISFLESFFLPNGSSQNTFTFRIVSSRIISQLLLEFKFQEKRKSRSQKSNLKMDDFRRSYICLCNNKRTTEKKSTFTKIESSCYQTFTFSSPLSPQLKYRFSPILLHSKSTMFGFGRCMI